MKIKPALLLATLAAFAAAAPSAQAANGSWNSATVGNWSGSPTNYWLGGTIPGSTTIDNSDIATFSFTLAASGKTVTVDTDRYIGGISFGNISAFGYTLATGNLHLNSGGVIQTLAGNAAHTDTISSAIAIQGDGGSATFTAGATSATSLLSIGAVTGVSTSGNTTTLTLNGTNTGANAITGVIGNGAGGGNLALVKSDSGRWTLSGANSFTGGVTINNGTLTVTSAIGNGGSNGSLGASASAANNILINGGTLKWNAPAESSNRTLTFGTNGGTFYATSSAAAVGITLSSAVALNGSGPRTITLQTDANKTNEWSTFGLGDQGGATSLVVAGGGASGLWKLGGNLTFSGGLTVSSGDLALTGTQNNFSGGVTVASGATLYLAATSSMAQNITNNGMVGIGTYGSITGTFSGDISGTGSVNGFANAINLVLTSSNSSYTGTTSLVTNGAASYGLTVSKLADGGSNSSIGASGSAASNLLLSQAFLKYVGTGDSTDRLFTINGTGAGVGAALDASGTGAINFTNNGGIAYGTTDQTRTLTLQGTNTGNNTLAPTIADNGTGAVSLTKTGAGTWVLSGNNSYSGATTLTTGILGFANTSAKSSSTTVTAAAAGTVGLGVGGSGYYNSANVDSLWANTLTGFSMDAASGIAIDTTAGDFTYSTNQSTRSLAKLGSNTLTLNGTNTYSGMNTVIGGTLQFAKTSALYNSVTTSWTAAKINVKSGATLAFNVGGAGEFTTGNVTTLLTNLAASSSATNGMNAGSALGFDTTNAGGSFTITNAIANTTGASGGARGLTKLGTGALVLTGNNTYTGPTTVTVGTLLIAYGGTVNTSSGLSVSAGATLNNANGASITPTLILQEGATLISSAASSTFAPTSLTLSGNLSDGWTTIALTNSGGEATLLTKSGALTLTLTGINDGTYSLTSATGFTGTFTSANVNGGGLATTDGGATFTGTVGGFNYTFTNANDQLIIVAIPEPATWALLAFGLTTVMVLRRRRNS